MARRLELNLFQQSEVSASRLPELAEDGGGEVQDMEDVAAVFVALAQQGAAVAQQGSSI